MFGIGGIEFVIILVFGFIIFGPDKLPEIANTVVKAINKFRGAQEQMSSAIKTGVYDPNSDEPFKNPLDIISNIASEDKSKASKPDQTSESLADRKAKYQEKKEQDVILSEAEGPTDKTDRSTKPAQSNKPSVEDLYAKDSKKAKPAAKKTVKRAPTKKAPDTTTSKSAAKPKAKTDTKQEEAK